MWRDEFAIPDDLAIPAFLKRELRHGFEYLGKGEDGEDLYRCPDYALRILAEAKLEDRRK